MIYKRGKKKLYLSALCNGFAVCSLGYQKSRGLMFSGTAMDRDCAEVSISGAEGRNALR